jgi:Cu/Ag efflux pump CusA
VPGLEVNFPQPIRDNVNENISGQFGQIALKIYTDDHVLPVIYKLTIDLATKWRARGTAP